jgi:hypothetical protein
MNNLFVCHTQANLLLACALAKGRLCSDENHLILFEDFKASQELRIVLEQTFSKVLYRTGTFLVANKTWKAKLNRYPNDLNAIKSFMDTEYDNVFEVCDDCIPELYILKRAFKKNKNVDFAWLEDGSFPYFRNTINVSGFSTNSATRFIRQIVFKYLLGFGMFYDFEGLFMGSNRILKKAYLTFPDKQRSLYASKEIIGITDEEFKKGMTTLYPPQKENRLESGDVLLVLDKLDVYKDVKKIKSAISELVENFQQQGLNIYYKYHPREESQIEELKSCKEIPRFTGVENIYSASQGNNILIIGVKSTGLQNAIKMGFKVISIANVVDERDSDVFSFYSKIGVNIINSYENLNNILQSWQPL